MVTGIMSVPRSIQRIVTVPSGSGIPETTNIMKGDTPPMFEVRMYAMD